VYEDNPFLFNAIFSILPGVAMLWETINMTTSLPIQRHEQRKIEKLLVKLAKTKPISAQPAPIANGKIALKTA
jgi:hypothetical protein